MISIEDRSWDTYPDFTRGGYQHVRGSYNPETHRYSLNRAYFMKLSSGAWTIVWPSWGYEQAGQTAFHERSHGPKWGLQHTGVYPTTRSAETDCWDY